MSINKNNLETARDECRRVVLHVFGLLAFPGKEKAYLGRKSKEKEILRHSESQHVAD